MSVVLVPPHKVVDVWPLVSHLIDRAFEYSDGKFSKTFVFDQLLADKMQLWVSEECALVTRPLDYPEKRIFELFLCGGERLAEYLPEGMPMLEDYARKRGCNAMEIWGRRGWERFLKPHGFEHGLYVTRKEL